MKIFSVEALIGVIILRLDIMLLIKRNLWCYAHGHCDVIGHYTGQDSKSGKLMFENYLCQPHRQKIAS